MWDLLWVKKKLGKFGIVYKHAVLEQNKSIIFCNIQSFHFLVDF